MTRAALVLAGALALAGCTSDEVGEFLTDLVMTPEERCDAAKQEARHLEPTLEVKSLVVAACGGMILGMEAEKSPVRVRSR